MTGIEIASDRSTSFVCGLATSHDRASTNPTKRTAYRPPPSASSRRDEVIQSGQESGQAIPKGLDDPIVKDRQQQDDQITRAPMKKPMVLRTKKSRAIIGSCSPHRS
jgi:hypothetical protein